jgi:hypothetical protein
LPPISNEHGRVDSENNVFVIDGGAERKVGQYPGVTEAEAFAYFERKFQELEANVRILEQRVKNNADAASIATAAEKLTKDLLEPTAVGNLQELRNRVSAITPKIEKMRTEKTEANAKAIAAALKLRTEIAEKAKALADKDPKKTQWKIASKEMTELFEAWQASQKASPKVPRKEADLIWKVFSQARTKFEANKRAFFAELTVVTKNARAKKSELASKAEALVSKGADAASDYRKLLDDWKLSGRSQGKQDDALWERFKAAGDAIYALRKDVIAKEQVEFSANYEAKLAIIVEAEKLDPSKDLAEAKKALLSIQQRYEKAGKVPKDKIRETDDRMRAVEKKFKDIEQEHWRKSDPAAIERTNGMLTQLEESITALEAELAAASSKSDTKKTAELTAALAARKSWLEVVKQNAN